MDLHADHQFPVMFRPGDHLGLGRLECQVQHASLSIGWDAGVLGQARRLGKGAMTRLRRAMRRGAPACDQSAGRRYIPEDEKAMELPSAISSAKRSAMARSAA